MIFGNPHIALRQEEDYEEEEEEEEEVAAGAGPVPVPVPMPVLAMARCFKFSTPPKEVASLLFFLGRPCLTSCVMRTIIATLEIPPPPRYTTRPDEGDVVSSWVCTSPSVASYEAKAV